MESGPGEPRVGEWAAGGGFLGEETVTRAGGPPGVSRESLTPSPSLPSVSVTSPPAPALHPGARTLRFGVTGERGPRFLRRAKGGTGSTLLRRMVHWTAGSYGNGLKY